ncbi:MAG TPA: class I SAM-dependent methyltransferase [Acidimicrobiales bacterium]|nr:class I SAM-dependent methyltransferase [Acidimicrobiales bacterium]
MTDPRVAPQAAHFGDVADRYETARPLYPQAALSELVARCGLRSGTPLADLGAGTGKLTRQVAALGADVVAVEPAAGMRRRLEAEVPGVRVLDGTAEDIPLPDASVEIVTVGQAFHWFDTHRALDEIARVLRIAGWLALLWNERPESGWAAGLWDLRGELTGGARTYPGDGWAEVLAADERFGPRTSSQHGVVVTTTIDAELVDSESRSCVHVSDEARRQEVIERLRRFLDTHPEAARRQQLTYIRPCTLHLCQRSG